MARIRYLKPEFFFDEDLADLSFAVRLGFAGLWVNADKAGRLEDSPKKLKAYIFPYDDIDMESVLKTLEAKPFIQRYEVEGKNYIQIVNWDKHQKPHHTERESEIPPVPPLKIKGMEKIKRKEKQLAASCELNNGEKTVKTPLNIKPTIPPSYEEIKAYCDERKNGIDPEAFMSFYNSNGWMVGKNKMKCWKSAVITWEKRKDQNGKTGKAPAAGAPGSDAEADRRKALQNIGKRI